MCCRALHGERPNGGRVRRRIEHHRRMRQGTREPHRRRHLAARWRKRWPQSSGEVEADAAGDGEVRAGRRLVEDERTFDTQRRPGRRQREGTQPHTARLVGELAVQGKADLRSRGHPHRSGLRRDEPAANAASLGPQVDRELPRNEGKARRVEVGGVERLNGQPADFDWRRRPRRRPGVRQVESAPLLARGGERGVDQLDRRKAQVAEQCGRSQADGHTVGSKVRRPRRTLGAQRETGAGEPQGEQVVVEAIEREDGIEAGADARHDGARDG